MTPSEAAKLSRQSKERLDAEIEAYAAKYRPKVLRRYDENGHQVTVYEPADCCKCHEYVKPHGRMGEYEL